MKITPKIKTIPKMKTTPKRKKTPKLKATQTVKMTLKILITLKKKRRPSHIPAILADLSLHICFQFLFKSILYVT